jgi:hypothetical protein
MLVCCELLLQKVYVDKLGLLSAELMHVEHLLDDRVPGYELDGHAQLEVMQLLIDQFQVITAGERHFPHWHRPLEGRAFLGKCWHTQG